MAVYDNMVFGLKLRKVADIKKDKKENPILDENGNTIPVTLEYEHFPLSLGDYVLVLSNCNKPHNFRESKYNERRAEIESALEIL